MQLFKIQPALHWLAHSCMSKNQLISKFNTNVKFEFQMISKFPLRWKFEFQMKKATFGVAFLLSI